MATATADSVIPPTVNSGNGTLDDEFINGLVQGGSWVFDGPQELTFSFNLNDDGAYPEGPAAPGDGGTWAESPLIAAAVTQALAAWSSVANITFQQVTSGNYYFESTADLSFTLTGEDLQSGGAYGLGFFPDPEYVAEVLGPYVNDYPGMEGNIFLDNEGLSPLASSVDIGSAGYWVILHEIGHALGLKHPGDDGGNERPFFSHLGISTFDRMSYTAMTTNVDNSLFAASPMLADIVAIQAIYGANTSFRTGDDTYVISDHFADNGSTHHLDLNTNYAIWDAGGTDTLTIEWADGFYLDLKAGRFSDFSEDGGPSIERDRVAIAYGVDIENAIGGVGHDWIYANDLNNRLEGGAADGDDYIEARAGNDTVIGGAGEDYGDGEEGIDWLYGGMDDDFLRGGSEGDFLYGEEGADSLDGEDGNDQLSGGLGIDHLHGGFGDDTLTGGDGADSMVGDIGADYYVDVAPEDIIYEVLEYLVEDRLSTNFSMTIPTLVESMILLGSAHLVATGNDLDNQIFGNAGNNHINGGGGRDVLAGGAGDDVYILEDAAPASHIEISRDDGAPALRGFGVSNVQFIESSPDPAPDRLRIDFSNPYNSYSYILRVSLDDLPLVQGAGTYSNGPQTITGNTFSIDLVPGIYEPYNSFPSVIGEYLINNLELGWTSGWTYTLLKADIIFQFSSDGYTWSGQALYNSPSTLAWDFVGEAPDEGADTVLSPWTHALEDNVETLVLTGSGNIDGTGNAAGNIVSGNSGNNVLDGAGGADIIAGGPGNDTYIVDNSGDRVMELGSSGIDAVQSGVSYDLMQAWHVENLTLTGGGAVNGSGNWLDNVITGNGAANVLDGNRGNDTLDGGGGSDTLSGGLGDDVLVWDAGDGSVQGGGGTDTLRLAGSGLLLDLTAVANTIITDIEVIDLTGTGNNTLKLALADVLAISSTTDLLTVNGNTGDAVNLQGAWANGGGAGYTSYTQGSATLLIDTAR